MDVTARTDFPPVRACLFDMDGLLLDTEDKYTICTNTILKKYGRDPLPWKIKAQMQGRPGPQSGAIFHAWAKLPISLEEFYAEQRALQAAIFPSSAPLPGAVQLLSDLSHATTVTSNNPVHIALATSSHAANFKLKTAHLTDLFTVFTPTRRVLGDDPRIPPGRGKPHPDIYLLALQTINSSLSEGEKPITPEECLVFEDSVPGVESGRRAGMRVVWVPHEGLKAEYTGREAEVLAGLTGEAEGELDLLGKVGDGWGDQMATLERFPYEKYGIKVEEKQ